MPQITTQSIEDKVALVIAHDDDRAPLVLMFDPEAAERIAHDLERAAGISDRAAVKAGLARIEAEGAKLTRMAGEIVAFVDSFTENRMSAHLRAALGTPAVAPAGKRSRRRRKGGAR